MAQLPPEDAKSYPVGRLLQGLLRGADARAAAGRAVRSIGFVACLDNLRLSSRPMPRSTSADEEGSVCKAHKQRKRVNAANVWIVRHIAAPLRSRPRAPARVLPPSGCNRPVRRPCNGMPAWQLHGRPQASQSLEEEVRSSAWPSIRIGAFCSLVVVTAQRPADKILRKPKGP